MPHDSARVADTKGWLAKAAEDLEVAEHLFRARLLGAAVFHCQQAAEKSLKGFLAWHDTPFRKTHNLEETGQACVAIDGSLRPLVDRTVPLTEYAWKFRYPGDIENPTLEETGAAVQVARELFGAIVARLPNETRL